MHAVEAVINVAGESPGDRAGTVLNIALQIGAGIVALYVLGFLFVLLSGALPYILFSLFFIGPAAVAVGTMGWIFDASWGIGVAVGGGVLTVLMLAWKLAIDS